MRAFQSLRAGLRQVTPRRVATGVAGDPATPRAPQPPLLSNTLHPHRACCANHPPALTPGPPLLPRPRRAAPVLAGLLAGWWVLTVPRAAASGGVVVAQGCYLLHVYVPMPPPRGDTFGFER